MYFFDSGDIIADRQYRQTDGLTDTVSTVLRYPHTHTHTHTHTHAHTHTHTHTHPFNGPFSGTTQVCRYQKGKTNLDFTEARDSEWQWHQLGNVQVCTLLQTTTPAPHHSVFFTGRMPFLPPNQRCQCTEGTIKDNLLASYCPDTPTHGQRYPDH